MRRLALVLLLLGGCATTDHAPAREPPMTAEQREIKHLQELLGETPNTTEHAADRASLECRLAANYLNHVDSPALERKERLEYTRLALEHADAAIELDDERGEAHYHRAVAIGRILEFSRIPNPGLISDLDAAGTRAHDLDPGFDQAGPCLLLALLYSQAPAWPVGPEMAGEVEVIEELFEEAVALAPEGVENHVCYGDWLFEEARDDDALAQARSASELLASSTPTLSSHDRTKLSEQLKALLERIVARRLDEAEKLAKDGRKDEALTRARAVGALLAEKTTLLTGDARRTFELRLEAQLPRE